MILRQKKRVKIFAVSDIHGNKTLLENALNDAGFIKNSDGHLLVVLGDLFDRGAENKATLDYLNGIDNKILLRGNHEDILLESLTIGVVDHLQEANGTVPTLMEFFPSYSGGRYCSPRNSTEREIADSLKKLINSMGTFFESENYVFTHGWLPVYNWSVRADWRYSTAGRWRSARWERWNRYYGTTEIPFEKSLVVGHTTASYGSDFDKSRPKDCYDIFYGNKMIAIDAMTAISSQVNCLVLEDEMTLPLSFDALIDNDALTSINQGKKRVYISLADEASLSILFKDVVTFHSPDGRICKTQVVALHKYSNLSDLCEDFSPEELGLCEGENISDMIRRYYDLDDVMEYGFLAVVIDAL